MTGSPGFIGANLVLRLLGSEEPVEIVGLDNLNSYYDPSLKEYRLRLVEQKAAEHPEHAYRFVRGSIADGSNVPRGWAAMPRAASSASLLPSPWKVSVPFAPAQYQVSCI